MLADHQENISTTDPYLALVTLHYLNKLRGVEVEIYNKPYLYVDLWGFSTYIEVLTTDMMGMGAPVKIDNMNWLVEKGNGNLNEMPEIVPLNTEGWELTCSDTTYNGNKPGGVARMLDDDPATIFEPGVEMALTTITVNIDMKEPQLIHGFKFVQPNTGTVDQETIEKDVKYLLSSLKIEVSENGWSWEKATYDEGAVTLGNSIGETTFINIPVEKQKSVQYIRLSMNTKVVDVTSGTGLPVYSLRIGDLIPYTLP